MLFILIKLCSKKNQFGVGTVKEIGTWQQLVAIDDGHFAKFVKIQTLELGHVSETEPSLGMVDGTPTTADGGRETPVTPLLQVPYLWPASPIFQAVNAQQCV